MNIHIGQDAWPYRVIIGLLIMQMYNYRERTLIYSIHHV